MENKTASPLVAVIMGSKSDWETMRHADETLTQFGVAHECHVMSAHRTPHLAAEFSSTAASRGVEIIIAAAGGAAHLAGVIAAHTILPVLGVPMKSDALNGMDSLLATVQMPAGIPVGTLAIGKPGAINAACSQSPFSPTVVLNFARSWKSFASARSNKFAVQLFPETIGSDVPP
jgi:5-(carboxyamino)imidazole ribonucleotide mutase